MQLDYASVHSLAFVAFVGCALLMNYIRDGAFVSAYLHYLPGHRESCPNLIPKRVHKRFTYSNNASALALLIELCGL